MNLGPVLRVVGVLMVSTAAAMVPPSILAFNEGLWLRWAAAILTTATVGGALWRANQQHVALDHRAGLMAVGAAWLGMVTAGCLPFLFTGVAPSFAFAWFESVSGFTTTGATIFARVETLPPSILLWRSLSHWIGGMGIIVLGVAILPFLGVGGAQLFRAEAPGISTERLSPRIASTARVLWGVYVGLTTALFVTYLVLGMTPFEAVNHAMSTLATGGFSTRSTSLGGFSPTIQWVTIAAMFVAGINFTLHFRLLAGRWTVWFQDVEWRVYAGIAAGASVICFAVLAVQAGTWDLAGLRSATFNVIAVLSTTGFATADFAAWPMVCQVILLGLMFIGAMGGSTGGGFKIVRTVVVAKHAMADFKVLLHPRAVVVTRLGREAIRPDVLLKVVGFFAIYVATHGIGTLILTALGYDFMTSVSAALAAMSSIGPGLGEVGPTTHYGFLSHPALFTLSALMLLGRLEFYTLLMLFLPGTWEGLSHRRRVSRV